MRPTAAPDSDVLAWYLSHTASPAEREVVEHWAAADASHQAELDVLTRAYERTGVPSIDEPTWDTATLWTRVHHDIRADETPASAVDPLQGPPGHPRPSLQRLGQSGAWQWATAAGLFLVLGLSAALRHELSTKAAPPTRDYVTRAGERETITLADGTGFILAPASRLSVPLDYARGNRVVTLAGQAFFSVVHDGHHPFTIRTARLVATDIGTQFDVRAYERDTVVRVAVREGAVSLTAGGAPVLVRTNDLAVLRPGGGITVSHNPDVSAYTGWTTGTLVFRDVPLRDVAGELSRWYDVDIALASPALAVRRITLTVGATATDPTLQAVAALAYARMERRGRHVLITSDPGDR